MAPPWRLPPLEPPSWLTARSEAARAAATTAANLATMQGIVDAVNPLGGQDNCGNIIDAVRARLDGSDPHAVAPDAQDGSDPQIEARFQTHVDMGHTFGDAFQAVSAGGPGTMAVVFIDYAGGGGHVVLMANHNGTVGIFEGQDWAQGGGHDPREIITDENRALERYNPSNVGFGIVGSNP